jgi:hypothetical protein
VSDPTLTANLLDAWRNAERASEAARSAAAQADAAAMAAQTAAEQAKRAAEAAQTAVAAARAVAEAAGVTLAAADVELGRAKEAYLQRQRRQARVDQVDAAASSSLEPEPA